MAKEKKEVAEEPKVVKAPQGATVVDDRVEFQLRETIVRRGTKEAYFIDRPLKEPVDWTIGQMHDGLKLGGRIYVAPQVNGQVSSTLERIFGKGVEEDELIVYGGEPEPEVKVKRTLKARPKPEVEDTPSESRSGV